MAGKPSRSARVLHWDCSLDCWGVLLSLLGFPGDCHWVHFLLHGEDLSVRGDRRTNTQRKAEGRTWSGKPWSGPRSPSSYTCFSDSGLSQRQDIRAVSAWVAWSLICLKESSLIPHWSLSDSSKDVGKSHRQRSPHLCFHISYLIKPSYAVFSLYSSEIFNSAINVQATLVYSINIYWVSIICQALW